jgi:hypothetical protein
MPEINILDDIAYELKKAANAKKRLRIGLGTIFFDICLAVFYCWDPLVLSRFHALEPFGFAAIGIISFMLQYRHRTPKSDAAF